MPLHTYWLNSKTLTKPNAGDHVEQQELSFIAVGNGNRTAGLEDSLAVFYKHPTALSYDPASTL